MSSTIYQQRINTVLDYIEEHLDSKLTLQTLSNAGCLSKYHFHRVFKAITGETVHDYIKRTKMEKVSRALALHHTKSLTDIAFDMGYNSSANFSRDVSLYFDKSPSQIRSEMKPHSVSIHDEIKSSISFKGVEKLNNKRILYTRIHNGYKADIIRETFASLCAWAMDYFKSRIGEQLIGIGYDDPDFTPLHKCRYDACIVISNDLEIGIIEPYNVKNIKGGTYAVFLFEGRGEDIYKAWEVIFKEWVIHSDYFPDNRPHLEMYLPSPQWKENIYRVELCLPVIHT
ncbi:MAG: AraC family transcriptional regulator [Spirochaetaceae bacterium]|nr:AraC family transcriptional regulator [Spirochaetaceae bacterium]